MSKLFLVIGINPKLTSKLLTRLTEDNFGKLEYIKRVKKKSNTENLVIIDCIREDIALRFEESFKESVIVDLVSCSEEIFKAPFGVSKIDTDLLGKYSKIFEEFLKEKRLYLMKISQSHNRLV